MTVGSWNLPPRDLPLLQDKPVHHFVNDLMGFLVRMGGQVRIFGRGQNGAMPQNVLDFKQVDARFNEMSGIAVAQTVRGNLFFIPQS